MVGPGPAAAMAAAAAFTEPTWSPRVGHRQSGHEITGQYLRLRSDAQTECYPPLPHLDQHKNKLDPEAVEIRERSRLFIKADCKRAYFPGQRVEAILAANRDWVEAPGPGGEGFAGLEIRFEGLVTSYVSTSSVGSSETEELVLFSEKVLLKAPMLSPLAPSRRGSQVQSASLAAEPGLARDEGNRLTGLTVEPLTLGSEHPRLSAWCLHAVFPRVVHTIHKLSNKSHPFQRRGSESHTIILPPTFSDHRHRLSNTNTVSYRLIFTGTPFALADAPRKSFSTPAIPLGGRSGPKKSITVVPLLFLPLQDGPAPPTDLSVPPDYTAQELPPSLPSPPPEATQKRRRSSAQKARPVISEPIGPWVRSRTKETIKKSVFGGHHGVVTLDVCLADPVDVPVGHDVPISLICSVASKDMADLQGEGFLSVAPLEPNQQGGSSVENSATWPILYIIRLERSRAGWDREMMVSTISLTPKWDRLTPSPEKAGEHDGSAHEFLDPSLDSVTGLWTRTAHLKGSIMCRVPPPVTTPILEVNYDLHLAWRPVPRSTSEPLRLARWIGASGVDHASLLAHEERQGCMAELARSHMIGGNAIMPFTRDTATLTRIVTGPKMHTVLTSIRDPDQGLLQNLMSLSHESIAHHGDSLPSYERPQDEALGPAHPAALPAPSLSMSTHSPELGMSVS